MLDGIYDWIDKKWFAVVIILVAAYLTRRFGNILLTSLVTRTVKHRAHGDISEEDIKKRQDTLIAMSHTVLRVMIWLVAGFSLMQTLFPYINLTPILASASVMGVAIGFGAQTLIKDFLSGLFIILENQYRVGDVVQIDDATGTVEQITIRSTIIRDNDGSVHYIPNGSIAHAINRTMGFSKINMAISVPPTTDVDKLADIINGVGTKMAEEEKWKKKIMEPAHFLSIGAFTETSLEVKIIGKTQPTAQWSVTDELRKRLLATLRKEGIILKEQGSETPKKKK